MQLLRGPECIGRLCNADIKAQGFVRGSARLAPFLLITCFPRAAGKPEHIFEWEVGESGGQELSPEHL